MTKYLFQYTHNEEQKKYFRSSASALKQFKELMDSFPVYEYDVIEKDKYGFTIVVICSHKNHRLLWWETQLFNFNTMVSTIIDDNCGWNGELLDE